MLKHPWLVQAAGAKHDMSRWIRTIQGIEERPRWVPLMFEMCQRAKLWVADDDLAENGPRITLVYQLFNSLTRHPTHIDIQIPTQAYSAPISPFMHDIQLRT
jgi:hypothetical protein